MKQHEVNRRLGRGTRARRKLWEERGRARRRGLGLTCDRCEGYKGVQRLYSHEAQDQVHGRALVRRARASKVPHSAHWRGESERGRASWEMRLVAGAFDGGRRVFGSVHGEQGSLTSRGAEKVRVSILQPRAKVHDPGGRHRTEPEDVVLERVALLGAVAAPPTRRADGFGPERVGITLLGEASRRRKEARGAGGAQEAARRACVAG